MDQTVNRKSNNKVIVLNKIKTYFSKPQNVILLLFGIVLTFTTVAPIVAIVKDTLMIHPGTIDAHLTGRHLAIQLSTMLTYLPAGWPERICGNRYGIRCF